MALSKIQSAIEPGRSENFLWSILNATNAEMGGEYIETRLLSSGSRTNPWYQESSSRLIRPGELVAIDTDMVGPYGYDADLSRTFFCEPGRPTGEQKTLYQMAYDQVHHNVDLLSAGLSFREFAEKAWQVPQRFKDQAATSTIHGVGMRNEYPMIGPPEDFQRWGYDGRFEENMTVCIESYIGEKGGSEGVKLEQMVLITNDGAQLMSNFPFDDRLLS
jgi:Xaa-Pro aminopeptidase